ncbi:MAG: hypothetical protein ACOYEF_15570 [Planifilum sp.]|jgi:hypothetical protein
MVAMQAVVELIGMVPAFVWMGLIFVLALLIVLTVITTKRRSREVAELNKLFADSGDASFDQPLALKRRPRKKAENGKVQEAKRESGEASAPAEAKAEPENQGESEEEKGGDA